MVTDCISRQMKGCIIIVVVVVVVVATAIL